jgi:hypothetical protein
MNTDKRKPMIIITAMVLIVVILTCIWLSGVIQTGTIPKKNSSVIISPNFTDTNSSPYNLPSGVKQDIEKISYDYIFNINKWEFDPVKNDTIILYAYDIRNESSIENLQEKQVKNYTLHIIHDTEFETTRQEVSDYLWNLRKDPDYQINDIWMSADRINDPPVNNAEVWVYESTPENMKLEKTIIKGWKISVYPAYSPILTTQTLKEKFSNNSS